MSNSSIAKWTIAAVFAAGAVTGLGLVADGQTTTSTSVSVSGHVDVGAVAQWLMSMDTDHDGTVTRAEMDNWMDAHFKQADTDHDGTLEAKELVGFCKYIMTTGKSSSYSKQCPAQGKVWLAAMDTDKDGTVSKDEMEKYFDAQFDTADVDHDGTLDKVELGVFRQNIMAGGNSQ
jgi:Ca2+-binding EF-hand superfamily protein